MKPGNDKNVSTTNEAGNAFILASVFRDALDVRSHQLNLRKDLREPQGQGKESPKVHPHRCRTRRPTATVTRHRRNLDAISQLSFAGLSGAVDTAEDLSVGFNTVSHNPAVAMRANRRQRVDRALEAVERVVLPANDHFKRLVIFVFANFAYSHT